MKKINLSIPEPCHENWDQMAPIERGKFCSSCQKSVVDFTGMSDRQLAEFFKKTTGSVCGRFHQDQLYRDIAVPKKRIPWVKYFFQFTLPAFLISMKANAQNKKTNIGDTSVCSMTLGKVAQPLPLKSKGIHEIKGKVVDGLGNVLPGVRIEIPYENIIATTDASGDFRIVGNKKITKLLASYVGYERKEVIVNNSSIVITLDPAVTGEVVIAGYALRRPKKSIPLIKKIVDSTVNYFSVYPNPVRSNSYFKIDLKKIEKGDYTISIINMAGEVTQASEIAVANKKQITDFHLGEIAAGVYYVHLFNRKTGASYSKKIMVE
jgi:hypothetical protein